MLWTIWTCFTRINKNNLKYGFKTLTFFLLCNTFTIVKFWLSSLSHNKFAALTVIHMQLTLQIFLRLWIKYSAVNTTILQYLTCLVLWFLLCHGHTLGMDMPDLLCTWTPSASHGHHRNKSTNPKLCMFTTQKWPPLLYHTYL